MKVGTHKTKNMKQNTWGGKRKNSGRKKAETPSTYIYVRLPVKDKENIYLKYGKDIHNLFKDWVNKLLESNNNV